MCLDSTPAGSKSPKADIYHENMTNLTRRTLLGAAVAAGALTIPAPARAGAPTQNYWRYCDHCHEMFFDGYAGKGSCPGGGGHVASGLYFALPHSSVETPTAQAQWRYCRKCQAMFYNGYSPAGVCPAGGGHAAQGLNFVLPHDMVTGAGSQSEWRYCRKCHVMFYDGYENKGRCPSGGGHSAQGYMFVLPHL
ncbi:hypothetical protein SAMN04489716_1660 [Actinoplanes derwentensis]|uniref:Uncharacterized protein n=2 Tax=Actinoplanes derwentensis TaxID=113562 RepID=A0A1H1V6P4_9ACTN|nr:hypothetical protein SAMN04489716_1660 [Actinoplanes derwentensis]